MRHALAGWIMAAELASVALAQLPKSQPVGLVLGAGATVARGGAAGQVKSGEVLFAGDTLKAGAAGVAFLFCPEKYSATLPAGAEIVLQAGTAQVKGGVLAGRKAAGGCFLPEVQKLSVASQQHYGVMITRAGSQPPPTTTFEQRVAALPAEKRNQLQTELAGTEAAGPVSVIVRAAALERAGLWYDAGEAYRQADEQYAEVAWIKRKIAEMENMLLKEQTR